MATYSQIIGKLDMLKPNAYTYEQKIAWLNDLEQQINLKVIETHELAEGEESPYSPFSPSMPDASEGDKTLIAPAAFDSMYVHYLSMQIDYANGEFERFNNSNAMFQTVYSDFERWYNRTHSPKSGRNIYF